MRAFILVAFTLAMLLNACQSHESQDSSLKVTSGAEIGNDEYPAVVRISLGNSSCTASFISEDILLTAAHCVHNKAFAKDVKVFMHPLYISSGEANRADLALIKLPKKASESVLRIAPRAPNEGDPITIVGFGLSDAANNLSAGVKRKGDNTLRNRANGLLVFSGLVRGANDGVNSASASGDSGGPMLLDGRQVGVTSAGTIKGNTKFSIYVDLHSEDSKNFFRQAQDAGYNIPLPEGFIGKRPPLTALR